VEEVELKFDIERRDIGRLLRSPALRDAQADEEGAGRASEVHVMGGVARIR